MSQSDSELEYFMDLTFEDRLKYIQEMPREVLESFTIFLSVVVQELSMEDEKMSDSLVIGELSLN